MHVSEFHRQISPMYSSYETALIVSLYFLLTCDYKEGVKEIIKPEVANEKRKAVVAYIEEQVVALSDRKARYIMQITDVDVDKQIRELTESISEQIYSTLILYREEKRR